MPAEGWIAHLQTTAPDYMKGAEDLTIRNRRYLRKMKERGRIMYSQDSNEKKWDVEFREPAPSTYTGGLTLDFEDTDLYRQLSITWRGYARGDSMTEQERLEQQGDHAIVRRYDQKIPRLVNAMGNHICGELYVDGSTAANANRFEGVNTFMGQGTCAAGDIVCQPDGTYGGRATDLASEGGSWSDTLTTQPNSTISTDWPTGQGDAEYDFLAPKIVNWSSTGWQTGGTTWEENCERAIRRLALWCIHGSGDDGKPDEIVLGDDLYAGYLDHMAAKGRQMYPVPANQDFGFNGVQQEGVPIVMDFDCPAGEGYALNYKKMALLLLGSSLFMPDGPTWYPQKRSYIFSVACYGNMRYWSPKFFGKLKGIA